MNNTPLLRKTRMQSKVKYQVLFIIGLTTSVLSFTALILQPLKEVNSITKEIGPAAYHSSTYYYLMASMTLGLVMTFTGGWLLYLKKE